MNADGRDEIEKEKQYEQAISQMFDVQAIAVTCRAAAVA
jgi:hypothetical protein